MPRSRFPNPAALLAATTLFASICPGQTSGDFRADFASMFLPSGPQGGATVLHLDGGLPPVIGQFTSMTVWGPDFVFGGVIGSFRSGLEQWLPFPSGGLEIYVDPLLQLGTIPVPLGTGPGTAALPLPPDPTLAGLDLAWQAFAIDGQSRIAVSNLLAMNVGLSATGGAAVFAAPAGERTYSIPPRNYYPNNARKQPILRNPNPAGGQNINCVIHVEKNGNCGPLEIRDQTGAVLHTMDRAATSGDYWVSIPPGGAVYFYNAHGSENVNGLKWRLQC